MIQWWMLDITQRVSLMLCLACSCPEFFTMNTSDIYYSSAKQTGHRFEFGGIPYSMGDSICKVALLSFVDLSVWVRLESHIVFASRRAQKCACSPYALELKGFCRQNSNLFNVLQTKVQGLGCKKPIQCVEHSFHQITWCMPNLGVVVNTPKVNHVNRPIFSQSLFEWSRIFFGQVSKRVLMFTWNA